MSVGRYNTRESARARESERARERESTRARGASRDGRESPESRTVFFFPVLCFTGLVANPQGPKDAAKQKLAAKKMVNSTKDFNH